MALDASSPVVFHNEYLEIRLMEQKPKTGVYGVFGWTSESYLGQIKWHPTWRKYCFYTLPETTWDSKCLQSLTTFLEDLNKRHKEQRSG